MSGNVKMSILFERIRMIEDVIVICRIMGWKAMYVISDKNTKVWKATETIPGETRGAGPLELPRVFSGVNFC